MWAWTRRTVEVYTKLFHYFRPDPLDTPPPCFDRSALAAAMFVDRDDAAAAASLAPAAAASAIAKSRRAAAGRAELLAKWQHTDRLQNLAKLRRFWIAGGIRAG